MFCFLAELKVSEVEEAVNLYIKVVSSTKVRGQNFCILNYFVQNALIRGRPQFSFAKTNLSLNHFLIISRWIFRIIGT